MQEDRKFLREKKGINEVGSNLKNNFYKHSSLQILTSTKKLKKDLWSESRIHFIYSVLIWSNETEV